MEVLIGLVFLGAALAVAFVLPVISFLRATQANQRSEALARELQALRAELEALRSSGAAAPVAAADAAARAVWQAQVRDIAAAASPAPPVPVSAATPAGEAADALPPAVIAHASPDLPDAAGGVEPVAAAPMAGTVPPPDTALPPPIAADTATARPDTLEERIGARWLLYAGIGGLILGVSYFIKFAFDNGWVSEPLRVLIGLLVGGALVVAGQRFVQRGLGFFGHALSGGGLVVLYVALYASLHVYELIGPTTAFAGMLLVTLLGTWLADRHRVQVLGALALFGGFVTPVLVGGREDRQLVLFLYNAMLLGGALLMVWRHTWAGVAVLSYGLVSAMTAAWIASYYTPAAGLRTLLLVTLHLGLILAMAVTLRRQRGRSPLALPASWLLLTAPVAYHFLALWLIGQSQGQFLVYLLVATVAGLSASYHAGWRWARTLVLLLVALPFVDWLGDLVTPRFHTAGVVTACAIYLLHLAGQWRDLSDDDPAAPVPVAEYVHTHATGLFLPLALYTFFDPRAGWWNAPMLTALAGWNLGIAGLLRLRMPALSWQFLALAGTLGAIAISEWFDGPVVAIGWALEGAAIGYAAIRARNPWLDRGSLVLFVGAALRLVDTLASPMALGTWPVVNARALATLVVVGAMAWLAARLRDAAEGSPGRVARHALIIGAHVLVIGWISAEIVHVFGQRAYAASAAGLPAQVARAELAQQVALSVAWALYAVGLIATGFSRQYAPARYLGIALFGLTIVKVMTKDIAELDRVYQMLSVLVVGALLVAASYLYQRVTTRRVRG